MAGGVTVYDAEKVVLYVVHSERVLTFTEPDFPDLLPQVPGGTIDPGEAVDDAARRELLEETGLSAATLTFMGAVDFQFERHGRTHRHRRHMFKVTLAQTPPETWDHYETSPSTVGAPILFRFAWMMFDEAAGCLGYGFAEGLSRVRPLTGS